MKKIANPAHGSKYNKAHPPRRAEDMVSVAESHEEHLLVAFPSVQAELERLKSLSVPAGFRTKPGHLNGLQLAKLGVPGICKRCGALADSYSPDCKVHPVLD